MLLKLKRTLLVVSLAAAALGGLAAHADSPDDLVQCFDCVVAHPRWLDELADKYWVKGIREAGRPNDLEFAYCDRNEDQDIYCFGRARVRVIFKQEVTDVPFEDPIVNVEVAAKEFAYPDWRLEPVSIHGRPVRQIKSIKYAETIGPFEFGYILTDDLAGGPNQVYLVVSDREEVDRYETKLDLGLPHYLRLSRESGGAWVNSVRFANAPSPSPDLALPAVRREINWTQYLRVPYVRPNPGRPNSGCEDYPGCGYP